MSLSQGVEPCLHGDMLGCLRASWCDDGDKIKPELDFIIQLSNNYEKVIKVFVVPELVVFFDFV